MHRPHPLQKSSRILYVSRSLQAFAGHFLSLICASYSSLKYLMVLKIGFGAVCPRPHRDVTLISLQSFSRSSRSPSLPRPFVILSSISRSLFVPILQGTHFPQDSAWVNSRKNLAIFTMQSSSSRTTIPPEPTIAPV